MGWRRAASVGRLRQEYLTLDADGDAAGAERLARRLVERHPDDGATWFNLGLYAKARRDWPESARCNSRALTLARRTQDEPAAWNLGIAATALGDWAEARRAWRAYGVDVPDGDGPVELPLGHVPVRLNPDDDGSGGPAAEVVWARRLSPAHVRVVSVPTPPSAHRFGDVLLVDGVPHGERFDGRRWVSVFDEIAVLERSTVPSWTAEVTAPSAACTTALRDAAAIVEVEAQDWTATVRRLCVACSTGRPGPGHDHEETDEWSPDRTFGLSGTRTAVRELLDAWARERPDRSVVSVTEIV